MDCFQTVLLLLLISSCRCHKSGSSCCIEEHTAGAGEDDCGCEVPKPPQTAINRSGVESDQTAPYPFPPYPVFRE